MDLSLKSMLNLKNYGFMGYKPMTGGKTVEENSRNLSTLTAGAQTLASGPIATQTEVPVLENLVNQQYGNFEYTPSEFYESKDYNPDKQYQSENITAEQLNNPYITEYQGNFDIANMSPTELRNILNNPEYKQAQNDTLSQLGIIANQGMSSIDKARLQDIQNQVANTNRANTESILQNQRMRGFGGSGSELATQLLSQQNTANIANQSGMDVNAQAQARALQALSERGQLSSQLSNQDFSQQAQKAAAQDIINQFNNQNINSANLRNIDTKQNINSQNQELLNQIALANMASRQNAINQNVMNRQNVGNQNVDLVNQSNLMNLQNRQNVGNQNVDLRNQANLMNLQNRQDVYNQNVDIKNQANQYNTTQKPLTQYGLYSNNDQLKASALQNAASMQNSNYWNNKQLQNQTTNAAIGAVGTVAGGALSRK